MLDYPTIDAAPRRGVYLYYKLDGSQVRAEWSRKRGFYKFGRKTALLDDSSPFLPEAEGLFAAKYGEALGRILHDARWEKATTFCEFYGPESFAGVHRPEPHTVTLFDVANDRGILPPKEYLKLVGGVEIAALLHQGALGALAEQVSQSHLEGMTCEGVVCKGAPASKDGPPVMFKLKSQVWYDRLKKWCGGDEKLYERLK